MATYVLDLNDAELRIGTDGRSAAQTAGFALILAKGLLLGEDAVRQFRLHPRQASNVFWHRLDTDALAVRGTDAATHADLVFRQLAVLAKAAKLEEGDELIVAAPATTTADQLALLLGIAEEVGLRVTGLVDSAIASVATSAVPDRVTYIDVSLHRLFTVAIDGGRDISRGGSQEMTELSLSALLDAWLNLISDRFVRETRFDPLALAETEQQIYDQVYDWLARGAVGTKLTVEVQHRGSTRRIELPQEGLIEKARPRYELVERALDGSPVILSHRAAALPGFAATLSARGRTVEVLSPTALFAGIARHVEAIRSDPQALRLVTRLPSAGTPRARGAESPRRPTHVLCGAIAAPIGSGLTLARSTFSDLPIGFNDGAAGIAAAADGQRLSLVPGTVAAVNRTPARDGMVLSVGDQIELGGARFHLIRVLEHA